MTSTDLTDEERDQLRAVAADFPDDLQWYTPQTGDDWWDRSESIRIAIEAFPRLVATLDAERARAEAVVEMLREVTSQHANGDIIQHYLDFRHHAGEACNWCAALDAYRKRAAAIDRGLALHDAAERLTAQTFHDAWVSRGMLCGGTHVIGEALCQNVVTVIAALLGEPSDD